MIVVVHNDLANYNCSKRCLPVPCIGQVCHFRVLRCAQLRFALCYEFRFYRVRLVEDRVWHSVPGVFKNQAGFAQLAQQIPMVPGKYFESSALVGRKPRYLQNNCGKAGNS